MWNKSRNENENNSDPRKVEVSCNTHSLKDELEMNKIKNVDLSNIFEEFYTTAKKPINETF